MRQAFRYITLLFKFEGFVEHTKASQSNFSLYFLLPKLFPQRVYCTWRCQAKQICRMIKQIGRRKNNRELKLVTITGFVIMLFNFVFVHVALVISWTLKFIAISFSQPARCTATNAKNKSSQTGSSLQSLRWRCLKIGQKYLVHPKAVQLQFIIRTNDAKLSP